MHYAEIKMAESMSTPTKISPRNPVCRLCGDSHESRYMLRIFSKAGSSKDLCVKVHKTCGIKISEDDMRSKVLCRGCVSFVNKMEQFIQRAQSIENAPSDQSSEYVVKRCVQLSPSSLQPSKRLSTNMPSESSVQVDKPSKPITPTRKQLSFSTPQAATISMPKSRGDNCLTSSLDQPKRNTSRSAEESSFSTSQDAISVTDCTITSVEQPSTRATLSSVEQPSFPTQQAAIVLRPKSTGGNDCTTLFEAQSLLTERQQKMVVQAVRHKDPAVLAAILKDHCPSVVKELKKTVSEELKTSCAKLCKRSQGSVLYGNDYDSMKDFDFNKVWLELKTNLPFLVELMNAVSGKENSDAETKLELQVKYSFLYSILMNERWHELNLVKRVNTVLIIEGGCTKKVSNIIYKLVMYKTLVIFLYYVLYSHCGSVINSYIKYNLWLILFHTKLDRTFVIVW